MGAESSWYAISFWFLLTIFVFFIIILACAGWSSSKRNTCNRSPRSACSCGRSH